MKIGLPGFIDKIKDRLKKTDDKNKINYYNAVLITYNGLKSF